MRTGPDPWARALTEWLRPSGTLPMGRVTRADVELEERTTVSTLTFLRATYSNDAPAGLPERVVVKQPLVAGGVPNAAPAEIDFYRRVAPGMPAPPLMHCLAAIEGQGDRGPVLVLEDIRATHDHRPWPLPPTRSQSDAAARALATIHGRWW